MLQLRFRPAVALIALIMLCSLLSTPRSTVAHAQSTNATAAPQAAASIEQLSSIGGMVAVLDVAGSLAYIHEGGGLRIVDVSDPTQPSKRGYLQFSEFPQAAVVVNTTAYVAAGHAGLQIVDVGNADSPQLLGHYPFDGMTTKIQIVGNLAYTLVTSSFNEMLYILDVGDPSQPVLRGVYYLPEQPDDFEVVGTLAFILLDDSGLHIVDVSNPANPVLRGSYPFPDYTTSIAVSGNRVYVGDAESYNGQSGLTILDVSDPANPALLGSYKPAMFNVLDIQIAGNLAYIKNGFGSELRIIDVSNPASPVVRGSYASPDILLSIHVADGRVYVTSTDGIKILDVTNPASPQLRGSYATLGRVSRVHSAGSFAYVVVENQLYNEEHGLYIVDASDPRQPQRRGFYAGFVRDVQVVGSLAYLATSSAFQIVDVSNPDAPTLRSSRSSSIGPQHILVRGNLAYVSGTTGLTIFDVSDPDQPATLGTYTRQLSPGYNFDVAGNFAYLTSGYCLRPCTYQIEIVDVSDPLNPTLHGLYDQFALSVDVLNNRAYVSGGNIAILDISNPAQPSPSDSYQTPGYTEELEFAGKLAYMATGGLHIAELDASGRLHPRATYATAGSPGDLSLAGDVVYLADRAGGLKIFRVDPAQFPASIFVPIVGTTS